MDVRHLRYLPGLLLSAALTAWAAPAVDPANAQFQGHWGGYLISNAFRVDPDHPGVILPPASARDGDLLWIRPQRLNSDEYLILQKCTDAACDRAQVDRAWSAHGYMGPYPVLTNKTRLESGVRYMLWLQRVPTKGDGTFRLIDRNAPPLQFVPMGSPRLTREADLDAARQHGPAQIKETRTEGTTYVVRFDGGSVVRMQALRPN